jgi:hypothetical protein
MYAAPSTPPPHPSNPARPHKVRKGRTKRGAEGDRRVQEGEGQGVPGLRVKGAHTGCRVDMRWANGRAAQLRQPEGRGRCEEGHGRQGQGDRPDWQQVGQQGRGAADYCGDGCEAAAAEGEGVGGLDGTKEHMGVPESHTRRVTVKKRFERS